MQVARERPLYGVAEDSDELSLWYVVLYPARSLRAVEVQRRSLPYNLLIAHPTKQRPIGIYVGDGLAVHVRVVVGPAEVRRLALHSEELGLFHGAHVDLRVLLEVVVERGGSGLSGAYDEEVRHRHRLISWSFHLQNQQQ